LQKRALFWRKLILPLFSYSSSFSFSSASSAPASAPQSLCNLKNLLPQEHLKKKDLKMRLYRFKLNNELQI